MAKFWGRPYAGAFDKVEAVQFMNANFGELERFVGGDSGYQDRQLIIATVHGALRAHVGDWIVKVAKDEFITVPDSAFNAMYMEVC